jgi:site-specific recombinase XerD
VTLTNPAQIGVEVDDLVPLSTDAPTGQSNGYRFPGEAVLTPRSGPPTGPPSNKGRKFPAEPLTEDEVDRLIAAAGNRSASGVRMRAMIAVMAGAGLRLAETLALAPRDIDLGAGKIRVRHGKGDKPRVVGIRPHACALVNRWMDRRPQLGLTARHPVFACYTVGKVGQPLQQRYVRLALARLGERAGIDKRVHPHGLRHSLASQMAERGMATRVIKEQLGHSSLATTDRYVHGLNPTEVVEAMRGWE